LKLLARTLNYLRDYWFWATGAFVSLLTAIIRAVLAYLRIPVMDEPTSGVDSRTERVIQHALYQLLV
jgi:hypothetical protein